jgi:hypothetical protein
MSILGRIVAGIFALTGMWRIAVHVLDWIGRAFDIGQIQELVGKLPAPLALPYEMILLALGPIGAAYLVWDFLGRPDLIKLPKWREAPVVRDTSVEEAIAYMCFGAWGRRFADAAGSPAVSGSWEYSQFQQAAADGDVKIWGRPSSGRVYEPIPKEFWRENSIEWFSLLKGEANTEPLGRVRETGSILRYGSLMTSRSDTERLFNAQSAETLRAKSLWSRLAKVFGEGVDQRNQVLRPLGDSEAEQRRAILAEWDARFLSCVHEAGITDDDLSVFADDPFGREPMGSPERAEWQIQLEESWNDKLRVLRLVMKKVHG